MRPLKRQTNLKMRMYGQRRLRSVNEPKLTALDNISMIISIIQRQFGNKFKSRKLLNQCWFVKIVLVDGETSDSAPHEGIVHFINKCFYQYRSKSSYEM